MRATGWEPFYASVKRDSDLVGAMVCYLKSDSYGEYVFDWAWADAYHRNGINYYPKCVTAIPFTPATGPRVLLKDGEDYVKITGQLIEALKTNSQSEYQVSISYVPDDEAHNSYSDGSWLERFGVQFHWFNDGFKNFDEHLATFNSKRRKRFAENEDVFLIGDCVRATEWVPIG